jgi:4-hydroxybenzoate polyprenyltransferase
MVRLPNLIFIALTQLLFYYCIMVPVLSGIPADPVIDTLSLIVLIAASLLIAAAGYIINDYFDINIDQVNKPNANVVDRVVSRRWAMLWHMVLSGSGVLLSFYVSLRSGLWYIVLANLLCVFCLFIYSVSLKRKLLAGNILISLLTAWVILVLCFSEWKFVLNSQSAVTAVAQHKIIRIGLLYASFAFISSLVREAIKDMEDREGDARYGCKTMPILWGLNATKVYVAVWLIVLLAMVIISQVYVTQFGWWWPNIYSTLFIVIPLGFIFLRLFRAETPQDFHSLSRMTKWAMLTGILSMIFFRFYL